MGVVFFQISVDAATPHGKKSGLFTDDLPDQTLHAVAEVTKTRYPDYGLIQKEYPSVMAFLPSMLEKNVKLRPKAPTLASLISGTGYKVEKVLGQHCFAAKSSEPGDWWWKCTRCRNKKSVARVLCLECPKGKQLLCHKCAALEHDWDGNQRFHSVEAIHPKQTTCLLSAMLDALFLPLTIFFVIRHTGIPEGYNDGIDVCPIVDRFRGALFSFDAGISLYTKHYFHFGCNLEDGYIRLWIDAFVRCIATDTDSFVLLVLTAMRAYAFHNFIIKKMFVPVGVFFEATVATLVYLGATFLPDVDKWRIAGPFKNWLTKAVDKACAVCA
jgi:hypothetical protein